MTTDTELLAQQAVWAGQHALVLFCVLLALLLGAACVCWWSLRLSTAPRRHSTLSSTFFIGLRIALGFAIILAGVVVFALLAGQLGVGNEMGRADQAFTDALRIQVPPAVLQVFAVLTHLADTATLTGLCIGMAVALLALGQRWLALGWVIAVAGNGLLNHSLKQIFGRVRPLDPDGVVLANGFSFPSGHSSGSVVAYGMLAYLAFRLLPARWHLPTLFVSVALAFTVGASRLFLRVHFASDVIAGFASGTAWLALCITSIEIVRWYRQRLV